MHSSRSHNSSSAGGGHLEGDRHLNLFRRRRWLFLALAFGLLLGTATLGMAWGAVSIPPRAVLQIIGQRTLLTGLLASPPLPDWPPAWETILLEIRIPRVVLAGLVGITLAVAGAVYQALFRNPLAEPYLIGVSSGASFGATLAIVFIWRLGWGGWNGVSLAAFVGALLATAAIYSLARVGRRTPITTLILAGVAVNALLSATTVFLMFSMQDAFRAMHVLGWLMGSLALADWEKVRTILPYVLAGLAVISWHAHTLNVLQLDEEQAQSLGVAVERTKGVLILAVSLATAAAVSVSGTVGFIGLIVPHIVRLLWGPDHRFLLPMSGVVGAISLILADSIARTAFAPRELPLGVVTAVAGAPFFLYLLRRQKREVF
ncbi:MAG: iron ABC transporter permease [Anaerolineae bacterium]|nr:iron ABC transporter permease [Anaerolineae bacterium]MDW7990814.1 iron ABC transporter permease [Anaerolineae bacterium]